MMILSHRLLVLFFISALVVGCTSMVQTYVPTPLPTEYIPTAVAMTIAAQSEGNIRLETTQAPYSSTSPSILPTSTAIQQPPSATTRPTSSEPTVFPTPDNPLKTPELLLPRTQPSSISNEFTPTFAPPVPDARIQIYQIGDLSKVTSPMDVSSRLTCGDAKVVRVELHGEDGRLLARDLRTYKTVPWKSARLGIALEFEINIGAELGRLVISAEDSFGRLIEVNSVEIVLLSMGMREINPPTALLQQITIEEPQEQALIQNGRVVVSGRARPVSNQPLRVMLVGEDGRVLGQRLASVSTPIPGDYGAYIAEVSFSVKEATPALLVVFEEGSPLSDIAYLTSSQVVLAP